MSELSVYSVSSWQLYSQLACVSHIEGSRCLAVEWLAAVCFLSSTSGWRESDGVGLKVNRSTPGWKSVQFTYIQDTVEIRLCCNVISKIFFFKNQALRAAADSREQTCIMTFGFLSEVPSKSWCPSQLMLLLKLKPNSREHFSRRSWWGFHRLNYYCAINAQRVH